ncbi:hypothetical protein GCM10009102_33670 [Sphingomonas insulae]|uniref:Uncharacterized protein n=1 Tax=Sphingomonas insulae TaxID=424800 RepID=A0ABN1I0H7_9SPHN
MVSAVNGLARSGAALARKVPTVIAAEADVAAASDNAPITKQRAIRDLRDIGDTPDGMPPISRSSLTG